MCSGEDIGRTPVSQQMKGLIEQETNIEGKEERNFEKNIVDRVEANP